MGKQPPPPPPTHPPSRAEITEALRLAGYALEIRAGRVLIDLGFGTTHGERYPTHHDGTHNDVDLTAIQFADVKGSHRQIVRLVLLAAVKQYVPGAAFVAFPPHRLMKQDGRVRLGGVPSYYVRDNAEWDRALEPLLLGIMRALAPLRHASTSCVQYAVAQYKNKGGNEYAAYASHEQGTEDDLQQLMAAQASVYLSETHRALGVPQLAPLPVMFFVVPALVLNCPVYTFTERTGRLKKERWVSLELTRDVPAPKSTSVVDVVSFAHLKTYAKHLLSVLAGVAADAHQKKGALAEAAEMQRAHWARGATANTTLPQLGR